MTGCAGQGCWIFVGACEADAVIAIEDCRMRGVALGAESSHPVTLLALGIARVASGATHVLPTETKAGVIRKWQSAETACAVSRYSNACTAEGVA